MVGKVCLAVLAAIDALGVEVDIVGKTHVEGSTDLPVRRLKGR